MFAVINHSKSLACGGLAKLYSQSLRNFTSSCVGFSYGLVSKVNSPKRHQRVLSSVAVSPKEAKSIITERQISTTSSLHYEVVVHEHGFETDLKPDATDIFKSAVRAVYPKAMVENVLHYDATASTLTVQDKVYNLHRNVFVVGFGNAVLGMARVVEDMLGRHIVTGIISIPHGLQEEMRLAGRSNSLLSANTRIQVYEGAQGNEVDETAHNASKAIHSLVTKLKEDDLLIVLCSGGGSPLCPSPAPPITLGELKDVTRLLVRNGASVKELNTVRKNIETLKGGGLAMEARPAKVVTLLLSSIIGDPKDLIASGPTCPTQPTPHHCLEILNRLEIYDRTPESIQKFLDKECKNLNIMQAHRVHDPMHSKAEQDAIWNDVTNIVVGNNSIACEMAASRAAELGYLPLILTKVLTGEARDIGYLYAKLAKFIMICFDRKASMEPNSELVVLELELVGGGIRKEWINYICNSVDQAHNMNKDICVIAGGETTVHVAGSGVGGKNMESALAAAIQMQEEFRDKEMNVSETRMCFLSCDTDGHDGVTNFAGAVVDQDLLDKVEENELDMKEFVQNNDSYTFFVKVNGGRNLVRTNLTGTNVMDMIIMLVQKPREKKYQWT